MMHFRVETALLSAAILLFSCGKGGETPIKIAERDVDVSQMDRAAEFVSTLMNGWNVGRFEPFDSKKVAPKIANDLSPEKQKQLFEGRIRPACGNFQRLTYVATYAKGQERIYHFIGTFDKNDTQLKILVGTTPDNVISDLVISLP